MNLVMSALAAVSLVATGASATQGANGAGKNPGERRLATSDNSAGAIKSAPGQGTFGASGEVVGPIILADGRRI